MTPHAMARSEQFAGYARIYAALAVVLLVLSFQPLFVLSDGRLADSLWVELGETGHEVSVLSALFVLVLCGLLVAGAFRCTTLGIPVGIGVCAAFLVLILVTRPGYSARPDLTDWGRCGLALGFLTLALCVVHGTHLVITERAAPARRL